MYGCPASFEGTNFEDIDVAAMLMKRDDGIELSAKEKAAMQNELRVVARSATMLTKLSRNFNGIIGCIFGTSSKVGGFTANWYDWCKDHEDDIADIARQIDGDIPAKIQFFISDTVNSYLIEAKCDMPDELRLTTSSMQRSILSNSHSINLPKWVLNLLRPTKPKAILGDVPPGDAGGAGGPGKGQGKRGEQVIHENQDERLHCSAKFYSKVIHQHGIKADNVSAPTLEDGSEECLRYALKGVCVPGCRRKKAHKPPKGKRREGLLKFKSECLARYNANKGEGETDFQ